jgi:hypothetical protein
MGSTHSSEQLEAVWPDIIYYNAAEQATYADMITKSRVLDNDFVIAEIELKDCDATTVGNAAYSMLYCSAAIKQDCELQYKALITRLKEVHPKTSSEAEKLLKHFSIVS